MMRCYCSLSTVLWDVSGRLSVCVCVYVCVCVCVCVVSLQGVPEQSLLSAQFCCRHKTALKNKVY